MNVSCTQCQTVFRVDPAKVPAEGVRARCSVCSGIFWVRREGAPQPAPVAVPVPAPAPVAAPLPPPVPAAAPMPVAPPVPRPVVAPAAPPPPAPPVIRPAAPPAPVMAPAPAAVPAVPLERPRRPGNPFLSQDPAARARRLARALVSDIVVYHPAKRRDALRDGSLKILFEEEIRKSWEEYVEQVGRELAESTPFFNDALNEILADGQPVFP